MAMSFCSHYYIDDAIDDHFLAMRDCIVTSQLLRMIVGSLPTMPTIAYCHQGVTPEGFARRVFAESDREYPEQRERKHCRHLEPEQHQVRHL